MSSACRGLAGWRCRVSAVTVGHMVTVGHTQVPKGRGWLVQTQHPPLLSNRTEFPAPGRQPQALAWLLRVLTCACFSRWSASTSHPQGGCPHSQQASVCWKGPMAAPCSCLGAVSACLPLPQVQGSCRAATGPEPASRAVGRRSEQGGTSPAATGSLLAADCHQDERHGLAEKHLSERMFPNVIIIDAMCCVKSLPVS